MPQSLGCVVLELRRSLHLRVTYKFLVRAIKQQKNRPMMDPHSPNGATYGILSSVIP